MVRRSTEEIVRPQRELVVVLLERQFEIIGSMWGLGQTS
jgi:hypothetical protein